MKIKFSIIIPAFNVGALVKEAINSCLAQKGVARDDFEIIVVNDGSTDDTPRYIAEYADEIVLVDKANGGLSSARNAGIARAKGDYILFLDADDWLEPQALASLAPHLAVDTILIFAYNICFKDGGRQTLLLSAEEKAYPSGEFLRRIFAKRQFYAVGAPFKCYPRSLFFEKGLRFIDGLLHEDAPFFAQAAMACPKLHYIDAPLYNYRAGRDGAITSTCRLKNFTDMLRVNEIISVTLPGSRERNLWMLAQLLYCYKMPFRDERARREVIKAGRAFSSRRIALRLLLTARFAPEISLRALLFLADPTLLLRFNTLGKAK